MLFLLLLQVLLSELAITSIVVPTYAPKPHCRLPAPPILPKITDCLHIVRDIRIQNEQVRDRIFTASRRRGSNLHLPNTWWDHVPHSTCAIYLDMVNDRQDASDMLRLEDVFRAAEEIIEECLVPRLAERWEGSEGVSPILGFTSFDSNCSCETSLSIAPALSRTDSEHHSGWLQAGMGS